MEKPDIIRQKRVIMYLLGDETKENNSAWRNEDLNFIKTDTGGVNYYTEGKSAD